MRISILTILVALATAQQPQPSSGLVAHSLTVDSLVILECALWPYFRTETIREVSR